MPNTLPVPSKAALRALRNLALGTSCTVVVTTGLLTEDRRRRIHAAREVHSNAKKLKSSRKYHSGGSPATETFEEQVLRYRDDGFWQAKDLHKTIEPVQITLPLEPTIPKYATPRQRPSFSNFSRFQLFDSSTPARRFEPMLVIPRDSNLPRVPATDDSGNSHRLHRQQKLALDVLRLLEDKGEPSIVEAAALRFLDAFDEGLPIDDSGIMEELNDAAVQLSKACRLQDNFEASQKILHAVLSSGPIDEDIFHSLGAEGVIRNLIKGSYDQVTSRYVVEDSKLRKAAALYLTKFKEKPRVTRNSWRRLGDTLCAATCRHELFDLTEALYWRMGQCADDATNRSVHHLMTALYKQGMYEKVTQLFLRLYENTHPDPLQFYNIGDIVIQSTLEMGRSDITEDILLNLAKMGEDLELKCSTTWFLKVLGTNWRKNGDIFRTRALFERLVPYCNLVAHPQAFYGAIIQFCIEAGDEASSRSYYERLEKAYGPPTADGIRIYGHFAYAKAAQDDWTGVKDDFWKMSRLSPDKHDYSASFTPIFKLFAKSHSVNETEEFLRTFIDDYGVVLTPYLSTTMINKYAEAREIDSILRWLDYMVSLRSPVDAMFFNAIFAQIHKQWKFSFHEMYRLYQKVRKVDGQVANFINDGTFSILRRAAIADASQDVAGAVRNLNRLKLDQPLQNLVNSQSIQEAMSVSLAKGNPRRALKIYQKAQDQDISLHGACIATAIKASLQVTPNDIYIAANLLQKPQSDGNDISDAVATIFIHQLSCQCASTKHMRVQDIARNTISALEDRGITVPIRVITHTTHTLVYQGHFHQAIEFWSLMSRSHNTPNSFDLHTLTVLLRAYIGVQDGSGVEWTIQMLSINGLVPDETFKRSLKTALGEKRRILEASGCERTEVQFIKALKNALQSVSKMRLQATKDKEYVKMKTIQIIEKAVEIQRATCIDVEAEKTSKPPRRSYLSKGDRSRSFEASEGALESWMDKDEEPEYHVDIQPVSRLVGVNVG